jgi:hypothetical protein
MEMEFIKLKLPKNSLKNIDVVELLDKSENNTIQKISDHFLLVYMIGLN